VFEGGNVDYRSGEKFVCIVYTQLKKNEQVYFLSYHGIFYHILSLFTQKRAEKGKGPLKTDVMIELEFLTLLFVLQSLFGLFHE